MKKILFSVLALAMAAFSFTSCEDVPAPYDDPNAGGGGEVVLPEGVLLDQSFTNSLGSFTSVSASGSLKWYNDYSSAMVTGFQDFNGDGQNYKIKLSLFKAYSDKHIAETSRANRQYALLLRLPIKA